MASRLGLHVDGALRAALDRSPIAMAVGDLNGVRFWMNRRYHEMLGYEYDELIGGGFAQVVHPDDVEVDRRFVLGAYAGGSDVLEREKRYLHKDGSTVWARVVAQIVRDQSGVPLYFLTHARDSSESHRADRLLQDSERTLRSVVDNTPALISVKGRDRRYKLVNREFERAYGLERGTVIGRSDVELLPELAIADTHVSDQSVIESGETLQEEVTMVRDGQQRLMLISKFPLRDDEGEILGVCAAATDISEARLQEHARRDRLECSELIYTAIAEQRFVLHAQPILHLTQAAPAAAELLIRMRKSRDDSQLVSPESFLPAAERFGLITVIDEWVIGRAVGLAAVGHRVDVNVSAKTVSEPSLVNRIEKQVTKLGSAAANLIFEITETAVAGNVDAARDFAVRMRGLGCSIALDDFGVGHGTFTYLRHIPVDYLKIDMQFVRGLLSDEEDRQVVQAIVGVARQFNLETVAEGVEDETTLRYLQQLGVDYVQGYLLGEPMPLRKCWAEIERQSSVESDPR